MLATCLNAWAMILEPGGSVLACQTSGAVFTVDLTAPITENLVRFGDGTIRAFPVYCELLVKTGEGEWIGYCETHNHKDLTQ